MTIQREQLQAGQLIVRLPAYPRNLHGEPLSMARTGQIILTLGVLLDHGLSGLNSRLIPVIERAEPGSLDILIAAVEVAKDAGSAVMAARDTIDIWDKVLSMTASVAGILAIVVAAAKSGADRPSPRIDAVDPEQLADLLVRQAVAELHSAMTEGLRAPAVIQLITPNNTYEVRSDALDQVVNSMPDADYYSEETILAEVVSSHLSTPQGSFLMLSIAGGPPFPAECNDHAFFDTYVRDQESLSNALITCALGRWAGWSPNVRGASILAVYHVIPYSQRGGGWGSDAGRIRA